jgi:protease-4
MFSRRHPILFFVLNFSGIIAATMIIMTLLMMIGGYIRNIDFGEKVGVVELTGVISEAQPIIQQIKSFRENDAIKAIVLRIDSPGGAVGPSQEIYREIQKTTEVKKVISSMGAVAASGGYYAAVATNGIMANAGTITGSIGVIMGHTNFQDIMDKIGLTPVVIKSGEFKDMGSPMREMSEKERQLLQDFVQDVHQQFVVDAAQGRQMEISRMAELADGRIYTGAQAKELGLIDRLGNLEDAIEWAGRLGGIEGSISAVYPPEPQKSFLKYLLEESAVMKLFSQWLDSTVRVEYRYTGTGRQ